MVTDQLNIILAPDPPTERAPPVFPPSWVMSPAGLSAPEMKGRVNPGDENNPEVMPKAGVVGQAMVLGAMGRRVGPITLNPLLQMGKLNTSWASKATIAVITNTEAQPTMHLNQGINPKLWPGTRSNIICRGPKIV